MSWSGLSSDINGSWALEMEDNSVSLSLELGYRVGMSITFG